MYETKSSGVTVVLYTLWRLLWSIAVHTGKCNLFVLYNKNSNGLLKDFGGMKKEKQVCWRELTKIDHGQQPMRMHTIVIRWIGSNEWSNQMNRDHTIVIEWIRDQAWVVWLQPAAPLVSLWLGHAELCPSGTVVGWLAHVLWPVTFTFDAICMMLTRTNVCMRTFVAVIRAFVVMP